MQDSASGGDTSRATAGTRTPPRLRLLGGFELVVDGRPVALTPGSRRLLAYLALQRHPVSRPRVCVALWDGADERQSAARLRSAVWRANSAASRPLVRTSTLTVALEDEVAVDAREVALAAHELFGGAAAGSALVPGDLCEELLPEWHDEWVLGERERLRLVSLEALEHLAEGHLGHGETRLALEAALTLVALDPLREAAYVLLVQAYLLRGNRTEAVRQYARCRRLLREELGMEPGPALTSAISGMTLAGRPGDERVRLPA